MPGTELMNKIKPLLREGPSKENHGCQGSMMSWVPSGDLGAAELWKRVPSCLKWAVLYGMCKGTDLRDKMTYLLYWDSLACLEYRCGESRGKMKKKSR